VSAAVTSPWVDAEAIKRRHPIVSLLEGYGLVLRPAGRALVGRCPFHEDSGRPNFHAYPAADPARDGWYCFRCAVGGDQISFVMRHEQLGFLAACERLGGMAPATPADGATRPLPVRTAGPRWDRLTLEEQVVMNTALAVYADRLWHQRDARAYLNARGVPDWLIRRCALGYADGHSLEEFLRRRSWLRVAERLGLLRRPDGADGDGSYRELLAGRVVVPELRGGRCVWFIGRSVPGAGPGRNGRAEPAERPKYLALPGERPVLGFEQVIGRREAFLVEGVFGWLTAVAWRLPAFSTCGTHLPPDRVAFLQRADVVYGLLDPDPAGREAAERFGVTLGDRWRPLWLPDGLELDDLAREPDGRARFFALLDAARRDRRTEETNGP
jgi:DNA primase